ncbi:MAG: HAD family hydrolase [Deltaproteobacteria bacterium]|jgi:HAD superfamily hydrolase (TIGR01509 family)|nr:HAD family hydrolase [Deltaproteobacteria bacterium]
MTDAGNRKPLAALFDFDMTIADTADSVIVSMNMFAKEKGLRQIEKRDLMRAIGLTLEETWIFYWGRCEPEWPEYYRSRYKDQELSGFKPFPDTVEVLDRLRTEGMKTAVVTNRWLARVAVEAAGLDERFDAIVGAEDAARPKPAPDPVLKALEILRVAPENAVMVGDSHLDMMAAVAAGVKAVGISTGGNSAEELSKAGAWKVCGRLGEVLEILEP